MNGSPKERRLYGRRSFLSVTGGLAAFPLLARSKAGSGGFSAGKFRPSELSGDEAVSYVFRDVSNPLSGRDIRSTRETVLNSRSDADLEYERGAFVDERDEPDDSLTAYAFALVDGVPIEYIDYEDTYGTTNGAAVGGDGIEAFLASYASGTLQWRIERTSPLSGPGYDWNLIGILTKGPRTYTRDDYPAENSTIGKLRKRIEIWRADAEQQGKRNYHCITSLQSEDGASIDGSVWTHSHSNIEQNWDHGHSTGIDLHNIDPASNSGTENNITIGVGGERSTFDIPYFKSHNTSRIDEIAAHKIEYPARFLNPDAQDEYIEVGNAASAWIYPPDSTETFLFVDGSTTYYSTAHSDGGKFTTTIYLNRLA